MEIYALNLASWTDISGRTELLWRVSESRRDKIRRYRHKEDAARSLAAELLARWAISGRWGFQAERIAFEANAYGKPRVKGEPDVHFNLTHAGDWVACAVGDAELGIDVEKIAPIPAGVADHYFTAEERAYIGAAEGGYSARRDRFYEIWTLKESYLKAIGTGLSVSLQSFSIAIAQDRSAVQLRGQSDADVYHFKSYALDPDYACAGCSRLPIDATSLVRMDADRFFAS